jgi:hypothetical protein
VFSFCDSFICNALHEEKEPSDCCYCFGGSDRYLLCRVMYTESAYKENMKRKEEILVILMAESELS